MLAARSPSRTLKEIESIETAGGPLGAELSLQIVEAANERLAPEGSLLLTPARRLWTGLIRLKVRSKSGWQNSGLEYSYREIDPDVFGEELENAAYRNADRIAAVVLTATRIRCVN